MLKSAKDIALSLMRMQRNKVAWPTFFASIFLLVLFAFSVLGYFNEVLPLWASSCLCFIAIHMGFAIAHEATHKTISNAANNAWLDNLLGTLHGWLLIYDFPTLKFLHLRHHTNTNEPNFDPDYWLQNVSVPVGLILGVFTPLFYLRMFILADLNKAIPRVAANWSYVRITAIIALLVTLLYLFPLETFFLWLAPASIASSLISVSHGLLHTAEQTSDRKENTLIVRGERLWGWIVTPFFWLNNNHYLHHEYPKLPFYTHEDLFAQTKDQLSNEGVKIVTVGKRTESRTT